MGAVTCGSIVGSHGERHRRARRRRHRPATPPGGPHGRGARSAGVPPRRGFETSLTSGSTKPTAWRPLTARLTALGASVRETDDGRFASRQPRCTGAGSTATTTTEWPLRVPFSACAYPASGSKASTPRPRRCADFTGLWNGMLASRVEPGRRRPVSMAGASSTKVTCEFAQPGVPAPNQGAARPTPRRRGVDGHRGRPGVATPVSSRGRPRQEGAGAGRHGDEGP